MAERRMFAKTIVLSDAFLDMPMGARCLYMTLGMVADDDGFVNAPKSIMRQCGASEDDMKILLTKKFLLPFESGVVVIKHWLINNYLQKDRYHETKYIEEKATLTVDGNGAYTRCDPMYTEDVYTQDRLGKDRLGKDRLESKAASRFTPPTVEEVQAYCDERKNGIDAQRFIDYYATRGWMLGKTKMKDWKAAVRTWERGNGNKPRACAMNAEDAEQQARAYGFNEQTQDDLDRLLEKLGGTA